MVDKTTFVVVVYFAVFGHLPHLPQYLARMRGKNSLFFDGAVFFRRNFALKTDILREVRTFGQVQCALACLSQSDCVAQTYCAETLTGNKNKGTCYLHKKGIKEEQSTVSLVKSNECTFQQYIDFYEALCTSQCQNGIKCRYDFDCRRCACFCEPPYIGMFCDQPQAISFRFTTLGSQGNSGPTSIAGYVNTSLHGTVTLNKGIQIWTVPFTALFTLTVAGASGGEASSSGGQGAVVSGMVLLTKGTVLHLLIGQKGLKGTSSAGGGGGTFVVYSNNTLLAAAGGGGGGGGHIISKNGDNGQRNRSGTVFGGVNGQGGSVCAKEDNDAGGGGGFNGDGNCSLNVSCSLIAQPCKESGLAYLNGGLGGKGNGDGGFGGGGAAYNGFGGGGGGYSGGGVHATSYGSESGGGGSYWTGELKPGNQTNSGDGYVLIDFDRDSI